MFGSNSPGSALSGKAGSSIIQPKKDIKKYSFIPPTPEKPRKKFKYYQK